MVVCVGGDRGGCGVLSVLGLCTVLVASVVLKGGRVEVVPVLVPTRDPFQNARSGQEDFGQTLKPP